MTTLKTLIISLCLILFAFGGFILFHFNSQYQVELALEAYQKGDYQQAKKTLKKLHGVIDPQASHLYLSYIAREQGDVKQSTKILEEAQELSHSNLKLALERELNLAFNAYLLGEGESFSKHLSLAKAYDPSHSTVLFFMGLEHFIMKDYTKARKIWEKDIPIQALSPWMQRSFSLVFNENWKQIKIAHCHIEQGHALLGRKTLEDLLSSSKDAYQKAELSLLIGLSYLVEAKNKPIESQAPYFELAKSYFDPVPIAHERLIAHKGRITFAFFEAAKIMIEGPPMDHAAFLIDFLEHWQAKKELESLAANLFTIFENMQKRKEVDALYSWMHTLDSLLKKTSFLRQSLSQQITEDLLKDIQDTKTPLLLHKWNLVSALSPHPKLVQKKVTQQLEEQILKGLDSDDQKFQLTGELLELYRNVSDSEDQCTKLAENLLKRSSLLWLHAASKGRYLMLRSYSFMDKAQKNASEGKIKAILKRMEMLANSNQDKVLLAHVQASCQDLSLSLPLLHDKQELEFQMEDAFFLYEEKAFLPCQKILIALHPIEPLDSSGWRLLAKSAYETQNYSQTKYALEQLPEHEEKLEEMMGVSLVYLGERSKGQRILEQLVKKQSLSQDAHLALALTELSDGDAQQALKWLNSTKQKGDPLNALSMLAAYKSNELEKSLHYYDKCSSQAQNSQGLLSLAFLSKQRLGQVDQAEVFLQKALQILRKNPLNSLKESFYLHNFIVKTLSLDIPSTTYLLAGQFYRDGKKNPKKSLEFFELLDNPSQKAYEKARAYQELTSYELAIEQFLYVLKYGREKYLKKPSQIYLAQCYDKTHAFIEATEILDQCFKENPQDFERSFYAQCLSKAKRWDLALEQYLLMEKQKQLSIQEKIEKVQALIKNGEFLEAHHLSSRIRFQEKSIADNERVKLAHIIQESSKDLRQETLKELASPEKLSEEIKSQLFVLYVSSGEYPLAQALHQLIEEKLTSSQDPEILINLAKFFRQSCQTEKALNHAQKALILDPYNVDYQSFTFSLSQKEDHKQNFLNNLDKISQKKPSPSAYLSFVKTLLRYVQKINVDYEFLEEPLQTQLKRCWASLSQLSQSKTRKYPEIIFLQGEVALQMGKNQEAKKAYELALELSPSYLNCYLRLAALYAEKKRTKQALEYLELAQRFFPFDAKTKLQSALLYKEDFNYKRAAEDFQKAISYDFSLLEAHLNLAEIYMLQKKYKQAKKTYQNAYKVVGNNAKGLNKLLEYFDDQILKTNSEEEKSLFLLHYQNLEKTLQALNP